MFIIAESAQQRAAKVQFDLAKVSRARDGSILPISGRDLQRL
jgi:hypothetical protein